ncbi:MAG: WD40/YVTN/BNR-like repeat-containing protein [Blastocatellia bacterium]
MKLLNTAPTALLLLLICIPATAQWRPQAGNTTADLRGLSVVNLRVVWASGTQGTFTRTTDGGASWQAGTVPGAEPLDFRDVEAFDANTAYLLSAGKDQLSRIYKTSDGGAHWALQFTNHLPEAFFDAMAFWDRDHGIALSDPVNGRFVMVTTDNGGRTWNDVPATNLPPAITGEGGFAASGTCLIAQGQANAWFVTGGAVARVFRSADRGHSWTVTSAPLSSGVESAGIFSVAFNDATHGVIVGGDYRKPTEAGDNIAVSGDGGRTWKLSRGPRPAGYRSGTAYVAPLTVIAVGTSGSDYSIDGGESWTRLDGENYNSVAARAGVVWAVGPRGRIARLDGLPGGRKLSAARATDKTAPVM